MNNIYKIIFIVFCFVLSSIQLCAQPIYVSLRPLSGYFIQERFQLKDKINYMVIENDRQFNRMFGKIKKNGAPNFELERVIVIACPPTQKQVIIGLYPKVAKAGNFMEVYCTYKEKHEKLPYTAYPVVLAAVPIYFAVRQFKFYDEESRKLITTVQLH